MDRYSEYRSMWVFLMFDLPVDTDRERKAATKFRKDLIEDGFTMFQFSVYMRHCSSMEQADMHIRRVEELLPEYGYVSIITLTDKQFGRMSIFYGRKPLNTYTPTLGLEFF